MPLSPKEATALRRKSATPLTICASTTGQFGTHGRGALVAEHFRDYLPHITAGLTRRLHTNSLPSKRGFRRLAFVLRLWLGNRLLTLAIHVLPPIDVEALRASKPRGRA